MTENVTENSMNAGSQNMPEMNPRTRKRSVSGQVKLGLKALVILALSLLLLIPQQIIQKKIDERYSRSKEAVEEVSNLWSGRQSVVGPIICLPSVKDSIPDIYLLPVRTQMLHRGIFDVSVYESQLGLSGDFHLTELANPGPHYDLSKAYVMIGIDDIRGLTDNVVFQIGDREIPMKSGENCYLGHVVSCPLGDLSGIMGDSVAYQTSVSVKGSEELSFLPVGSVTKVHLTSDCATPSFGGDFLPVTRDVKQDGFEATWKVLALNSGYSETMNSLSNMHSGGLISDNAFGVELQVPVEQYQQNTRSIKYAFLIILLTFATVFFTEIRQNIRIHPIQYLLVGFALLLFYTLLLSFSEHISFLISYVIAGVMTITMITVFLWALIKDKRPALLIGGLLLGLYTFIYILLQMESYALLAGSIGLFVILGLIMYITSKIKWYNS